MYLTLASINNQVLFLPFFFLESPVAASAPSGDDERKVALDLTRKAMDPSAPSYYFCTNYHSPILPVFNPQQGTTYLSVLALKTAFDICTELNDTNYISDLIQRVFSNSESLNNSFIQQQQDKASSDSLINNDNCFEKDPCIEYEGFFEVMRHLHTSVRFAAI